LSGFFLGGAKVLHAIAAIGNELLGLFPQQRFASAVARGECARPHAAVKLRFASRRAIGVQDHRTAGIDALEKSLRASRRDRADARVTLRGRFAWGGGNGKKSRKHDPATLAHGAKSLAFFAIMQSKYA
jgi:hypothetical protein